MLAFLWRSRCAHATPRPRTIRLSIEQLETRFCPSAPQLGLTATVLPGHQVQLSGMLNDTQPSGATVTFSGGVTGTATTASDGSFSYTTSSASLGTVYAQAVDQLGQSSNTAQAVIAVAAPSITLSVSYGSQKTITLSGTVNDIDASSLTVTFSGVAAGSATPNSNGAFSLTTQASSLGTVQAATTDLWGQASNTAQVTLSCSPPQITSFQAIDQSGNAWTLEGQVNAPSAAGLVVTFSDIPALDGQTATVQSDGTFCLSVTLPAGTEGTAYAQTTDWWGQESNVAEAGIN